jgi:hypothetical protein
MEYNNINQKAFSGIGTIKKMMGRSIKNSPFMQMADPLTGEYIDPTMAQSPQMPIAQNNYTMPVTGVNQPNVLRGGVQTPAVNVDGLQPVQRTNNRPPNGVQTPIAPFYDINNQ